MKSNDDVMRRYLKFKMLDIVHSYNYFHVGTITITNTDGRYAILQLKRVFK